jgi:Amt family ammonium transporter
VLCGIFATTAFNSAATGGVDGLLRGNVHFFLVQLAAVLFSSVWAFLFTLIMLWAINKVTRVRVDDAAEEIGLDEGLHGEQAYLEGV